MVELDSYTYPLTRNDKPYLSDASVCNVFTCKVLRAGGIFGKLGDEVKYQLTLEIES